MLKVTRGKMKEPFSVVLVGVPGIGKSTWAANAPSPIFLGFEENNELEVDRLPVPKTYVEFVTMLNDLVKETHNYKTVVIDSIDGVERALHQHLLDTDPKGEKTLAKAWGGYGAAFDKSANFLKNDIRNKLKILKDEKKMNLIIIAHTHKKTEVDTINGMTYDTYEMNLHHKAQAVFIEWVSNVLFATYVVHKVDDDNSGRKFVIGDGERVLLTQKRPGHIGKNRYNLPYEMPLDFDVFYEYYNKFFDSKVERSYDDLKNSISGLMANIKDKQFYEVVDKAMLGAGSNSKKLELIEKRLIERLGV